MAGRYPQYSFTPGGIIPAAAANPSALQHISHPPSSIPAKRESDDVQFVSANPVKKRKVDQHAISTTPTLSNVLAPPPSMASPSAPPNTDSSTPIRQSQAVKRLSTMTCHQPPQPFFEPEFSRGCSAPTLRSSDMFENLWTAPSSGPRESVPLSPKQLPQHVSPAMLQLHEGINSHATSDTSSSIAPETIMSTATTEIPCGILSSQAVPSMTGTVTADSQRLALIGGRSPRSKQLQPALVAPTKIEKQPQIPSGMASLSSGLRSVSSFNGIPTTSSQRPAAESHLPVNRAAPDAAESQELPLHSIPMFQPHDNTGTAPAIFHSDSRGQVQHLPDSQTKSSSSDEHNVGADGRGCSGDSKTASKAPCMYCLQKRMKQAILISNAASLSSPGLMSNNAPYGIAPHAQNQNQPIQPFNPASLSQSWPQPGKMATYPSLPSFLSTHPLTYNSMPSHHSLANQGSQQGLHTQRPSPRPQAPVAPMGTRQPPIQPNPGTPYFPTPWPAQAPGPHASSKPRPARQAQTQLNGKHIIVDIAETCLEVFPFEELAQRHNQPARKIRDVFEAIIQMPLMRCPTDRRRAGKQATAKVREYTQARRELQAQMGRAEGGQQKQQQPSAWDVAQFMGPSDMQAPSGLGPPPW